MSTSGITVAIKESIISSDLNSVVLFIFLMGMYTIIYFGTMYIYCTKNSSRYHPVPAAITVLYLSSMLDAALQWYATKWQFVDNGDTRDSIFFAVLDSPPWVYIAMDLLNCIVFVIADGLLIWRCFHVWNRSVRIISASLVLVVTEMALFLVQVAFNAKYTNSTISIALAARLNALFAAAYFISFGTTLVTTVLIAYRIYSVSNQQGASARRFKHIIDIVVQSGVVYAIVQLTVAISESAPAPNTLNTRSISFQYYTQVLSFAIAGISATVMVARVALLADDTTYPSTSIHLSGLQFHAQSTRPTVNLEAMDITRSVDGDIISSRGTQVVEEKAEEKAH